MDVFLFVAWRIQRGGDPLVSIALSLILDLRFWLLHSTLNFKKKNHLVTAVSVFYAWPEQNNTHMLWTETTNQKGCFFHEPFHSYSWQMKIHLGCLFWFKHKKSELFGPTVQLVRNTFPISALPSSPPALEWSVQRANTELILRKRDW